MPAAPFELTRRGFPALFRPCAQHSCTCRVTVATDKQRHVTRSNTTRAPGLSPRQVGGEAKGEIMSPALCTAFFSVFLDEEAVVARDKLVGRAALFF